MASSTTVVRTAAEIVAVAYIIYAIKKGVPKKYVRLRR